MQIEQVTIHDSFHGSTEEGLQPSDFAFRLFNEIDFSVPYEYTEAISKNDPCPLEVYDAIGQLFAGETEVVIQGSGYRETLIRKVYE